MDNFKPNISSQKLLFYKYKYLLWPVVAGVVSIAVVGLVIVPQIVSYLSVNVQIQDINKKTTVLETKAAKLEAIDQAKLDNDLQVTLTILPKEADVPKTFVTLQNIIQQSGLVVKSVDYSESRSPGEKTSFRLQISTIGQMNLVRNFLVSLEDSTQLFQVESIAVSFKPEGLEVSMPIIAYYEPLKTISAPLEQPLTILNEKEQQLLDKYTQLLARVAPAKELDTSSVPLGKTNPFE